MLGPAVPVRPVNLSLICFKSLLTGSILLPEVLLLQELLREDILPVILILAPIEASDSFLQLAGLFAVNVTKLIKLGYDPFRVLWFALHLALPHLGLVFDKLKKNLFRL